MAQQIFDQYAPLAKVSASETIPVVAAIAQTRNGKDELLYGTVPFVPAGGLYVPVSAANRLPVEATLSGRNARVIHTVSVSAIGPGGIRLVGVTATFPETANPVDVSPYVTKHVEVRNTGMSEIS